jgi:hypothetical protein
MSHLATLRDYRFPSGAADIRGASLHGEGGKKLAKIYDIILDHENGDIRYLVADYGRRVLVPIDHVYRSNDETFRSGLTSEDLDRLPMFEEQMLREDQWRAYEPLYRIALEDRDSLHQPERTNVTFIDRGRRWKGQEAKSVSRLKKRFTAIDSDSRWTAFQDKVRRELHNIRESCAACGKKRRIA